MVADYADHHCRTIKADICVQSGSEAGFTVALQAARLGKKAVLIGLKGHPGSRMLEGIVVPHGPPISVRIRYEFRNH